MVRNLGQIKPNKWHPHLTSKVGEPKNLTQLTKYKHNVEAQNLTKYNFPKPKSHHNKDIQSPITKFKSIKDTKINEIQ